MQENYLVNTEPFKINLTRSCSGLSLKQRSDQIVDCLLILFKKHPGHSYATIWTVDSISSIRRALVRREQNLVWQEINVGRVTRQRIVYREGRTCIAVHANLMIPFRCAWTPSDDLMAWSTILGYTNAQRGELYSRGDETDIEDDFEVRKSFSVTSQQRIFLYRINFDIYYLFYDFSETKCIGIDLNERKT